MNVYIERCPKYQTELIDNTILLFEPKFRGIIKPGDTVVLKPNWISHSHKYNHNEWEQVITHPLIIESVLKLVIQTLDGRGKIIIADSPMTSANWKCIMRIMNASQWANMGKKANIPISLLDLRDDEWITEGDIIVCRKKLPGDPLGSTICNLKAYSEFSDKEPGKYGFFGADYDQAETNFAHSNSNHYYKVSRSVLEADVFINLPKLKTHKKAGITCSLKNLVGINTLKNWLPHHTCGTPSEGGDQFPEKTLKCLAEGSITQATYAFLLKNPKFSKIFIPIKKVGKYIFGDTRKTIRSGSWYGNDTLWRMVLDLNKILFYANGDGSFRKDFPANKKRYISIVDAIISGEGNGPDAPDKKQTGLIFFGTDPVSVDATCAKMMGFDWEKIPTIKNAFSLKNYPFCFHHYESIEIKSSIENFNKPLRMITKKDVFEFLPPIGWRNHIEFDS